MPRQINRIDMVNMDIIRYPDGLDRTKGRGPEAIAPVDTESPEPKRKRRPRETKPFPRVARVSIIAQDPSTIDPKAKRPTHQMLRATVPVPTDVLFPGPRSHRFHVVGFNSSTTKAVPPPEFREPASDDFWRDWRFYDRFKDTSDSKLVGNPQFYAQNVYAIAARVLGTFEAALGRRVPWSFDAHQLYLVPDAFDDSNAYYDADNHAVLFGRFKSGDEMIHACLSHDIVAHEMTHAVLDGLRSRFLQPGNPDQLAFHEGFADVVALLSVFSMPETVEFCLRNKGVTGGRRPDVNELTSTDLFGLAEQFGKGMTDGHGDSLRRSVRLLPADVPNDWKDATEGDWIEPHNRGEILVASVLRSLLDMWQKRLETLGDDDPSLALIVEEGVKAAQHLLTMVIRALDFCPPVEFEFDDFLDSVITADGATAPDDRHNYRDSLKMEFGKFKIVQPPERTVHLYQNPPIYSTLNFGEFMIHADEVYRFVWQNAEKLGIEARDYFTRVVDVQPSIRVGPDGFVVHETIACYVQSVDGKVSELAEHSKAHNKAHADYRARRHGTELHTGPRVPLTKPDDMDDDSVVQLSGGGVLIFDQFGRPKFHQHKELCDWKRQSLRLKRLAAAGVTDSKGRYGFTDEAARDAFRFHQPGRSARIEW